MGGGSAGVQSPNCEYCRLTLTFIRSNSLQLNFQDNIRAAVALHSPITTFSGLNVFIDRGFSG
jgi:hypothetical protein